MHNPWFKGSENCVWQALAQDYFAPLNTLAWGPASLKVAGMDVSTDSVAERLARHDGIQRVPHPKIEQFQLKDFIGAELRAELIRLIDKDRRPSTIADDNGDDYFRTSETCDLSVDEGAVKELEASARELTDAALYAALAAILFSVFLSILFSMWIARPINRVAVSAPGIPTLSSCGRRSDASAA